jgi:hypothetical protein
MNFKHIMNDLCILPIFIIIMFLTYFIGALWCNLIYVIVTNNHDILALNFFNIVGIVGGFLSCVWVLLFSEASRTLTNNLKCSWCKKECNCALCQGYESLV